jgi:hypothetical protein
MSNHIPCPHQEAFIRLKELRALEFGSEFSFFKVFSSIIYLFLFRQAGLTMDARGYGGSHVLRKTVVTRMADLSLAGNSQFTSHSACFLVISQETYLRR